MRERDGIGNVVSCGGKGCSGGCGVGGEQGERLKILKALIMDAHDGAPVEELEVRFRELLGTTTAVEIAELERQLMADGVPAEEITRMCDLHVRILSTGAEEPVTRGTRVRRFLELLRAENAALSGVVASLREALMSIDGRDGDLSAGWWTRVRGKLARLAEIEKHYLKKEYQLFPALERRGADAPPKVMWAVHDDIRAGLKEIGAAVTSLDAAVVASALPPLLVKVEEMFKKEERILFPMSLDLLSEEDWATMERNEGEFGYALIEPPATPSSPAATVMTSGGKATDGPPGHGSRGRGEEKIELEVGALTLEQLRLMLGRLPMDISFVDENDEVRFYSEGDRIFPRAPGVIGRKVQNCHPPKSVDTVQRILDAFREGSKDVADFWIELGGKFIYIRYFAVRAKDRRYLGTLEAVQDVTGIRSLQGQRRLLDW